LVAIGSIAWRNLGLAAAAVKNDLAKAEACYRKAIGARPGDQTLYRDLAEILVAAGRRPEAIRLLETMPVAGVRRAEITVMLAQAYVDEKRWDDCVKLLESTPYFVNWEGQDITWRLFNRSHIERGRERLERGDAAGALADFEAALTYPANLNVGRSNQPEEAPAQYWRGKALLALGRAQEARAAWQAGAAGADVKGAQNEFRQKCREAIARAK
jgi:predicted Zn-dependent protease